MELPQPPPDQELKNIIDKLAQFVARNGPEFEQMTKTKQKDNPKFSFLFGGEYFNYYQYKVTTEQAILKHKQSHDPHSPGLSQPPPPGSQPPFHPGMSYPQVYPNFPYPPSSGYPNSDGSQFSQGPYGQPHGFPGPPMPPQVGLESGGQGQIPSFGPPQNHNFPSSGSDPSFTPPSSFGPMTSVPEPMYSQPAYPQPGPSHPPPMHGEQSGYPPQIDGCMPAGNDQLIYTNAGGGGFPIGGPGPHGPPMPPPGVSLETIAQQQQQLQEQIQQSEENLNAQQQVLDQQKEVQISEGIYVAKGEVLRSDATNFGFIYQELDDLLAPIMENCTKDSISNGKQWIFNQAVSPKKNKWIADYLLWNVRKNADNLKEALQGVLVPMFCHAMTLASDDQKGKLDKLVKLWESKLQLGDDVLNQLCDPHQSWSNFEKQLIEEFPQVVSTINQHIMGTFENYQQQHSAFVQHSTNQIQELEQQKLQIEHQAVAAQPGPFGVPPNQPGFPAGPPGMPLMGQGMDYNQPPPAFPSGGFPPVIDFSKPPPGFSIEEQKENLVPTVPYYDLPAGLMAPLINFEDSNYKPLNSNLLRLPPPTPPSERLLRAVENFYAPPSHERPRNSDGWEQLGLFDYYKAKSRAVKQKEYDVINGLRESSVSPPPIHVDESMYEPEKPVEVPQRRYRSVSPEIPQEEEIELPNRSQSPQPLNKSRRYDDRPCSVSPLPERSSPFNYHRSPSPFSRPSPRQRSRSPTPPKLPYRRMSRSQSPPSFRGSASIPFSGPENRLDMSNKGHQMLCKMGWVGSGLGAQEQGISDPIESGDVRETPQERFRGLGIPSAQSDPYEAFRKNKGQAFINRMKARAEERSEKEERMKMEMYKMDGTKDRE